MKRYSPPHDVKGSTRQLHESQDPIQSYAMRMYPRGEFSLRKDHLKRYVAACLVYSVEQQDLWVLCLQLLQADHGPCTRGTHGPTSILDQ